MKPHTGVLTIAVVIALAASALGEAALVATGRVVDADGKPVAGAEVQIVARSRDGKPPWYTWSSLGAPGPVRTGDDGTFRLPVTPGAAHVMIGARAKGFTPVTTGILNASEPDRRSGIRIVLPPAGTLTVRVVDAITHRPVPKAKVTIYPRYNHNGPHYRLRFSWFFRSPRGCLEAVADERGICRVPDFPAGVIGASARGEGYGADGKTSNTTHSVLIKFPDQRELPVQLLPDRPTAASGRALPAYAVARFGAEPWYSRNPVHALALSRNEEILVISRKKSLDTVDANTAIRQCYLGTFVARDLAVNASGSRVVALSERSGPYLFGSTMRASCRPRHLPASQLCVDLSPDGKTMIAGGEDGILRRWSTEDESRGADTVIGAGPIADIVCLPDGRSLALALWREVRIHGAASRSIRGFEGLVVALALSHDGRRIAAACRDSVAICDVESGKVVRTHTLAARGVALAYSPGDRHLAVALDNGQVELLGENGSLWTREADPKRATAVCFVSGGRRILACGDVSCIRAFDLDGVEIPPPGGHTGLIMDVDHAPSAPVVATAGSEGVIVLRDVATGKIRARLSGHRGAVQSARFSPDGRSLVSRSVDGTIRIWDVESRLTRTLIDATGRTHDPVSFSPDGRWFAAVHAEEVRLHRTKDGTVRRTIRLDSGTPVSVAVSPVGNLLAVGSRKGKITIFDAVRALRIFEGPDGCERELRFTRDGSGLVSPARGGQVRIWDVAGDGFRDLLSERRARWRGSLRLVAEDPVRGETLVRMVRDHASSVVLSPDRRRLVGTECGWNLLIWDLSALDD
jgi:WD40 repeat protein